MQTCSAEPHDNARGGRITTCNALGLMHERSVTYDAVQDGRPGLNGGYAFACEATQGTGA
jgi:hypothetical protein